MHKGLLTSGIILLLIGVGALLYNEWRANTIGRVLILVGTLVLIAHVLIEFMGSARADWRVTIGGISVAIGLLSGSIWAVGFWDSWGGWAGTYIFRSILVFLGSYRYLRTLVEWLLLGVGVLLLALGWFSFRGAERTRPFWKVVVVLFCIGFVLLAVGIGIFAVGMQRTTITELDDNEVVVLSQIALSPKEQYITHFEARVNEPPLASQSDPSPYVYINYNVKGTIKLYYNDPTGSAVSASLLSGFGRTVLSPSFAGSSELVFENVGDTEAEISQLYGGNIFYGLRENREIVGIVGIPVLVGLAIMGAGFVLRLHDTDLI